ncbi:MAG: HEPN domain-containing protein [bacterium]|nr:HEPN domain-containing protein [bacterium]MDW8164226.1 HEPN domain-containing protein [Candidatus Omnitrophota bacterium]
MSERSKDWIEEAENDIKHAENDLKSGFYNWACFSAQQAGEKAVKGVFQKLGVDIWGHSVSDLLLELSKKIKVPKNLIEISYELDKAYIPTRYPDVFPSGSPKDKYTKKEAERLIKYGKKIVEFCKTILSQI